VPEPRHWGDDPRIQRRVLNALLVRQGHVISRNELERIVYDGDDDGGPDHAGTVIRMLIRTLRKKGWPIEAEGRRGYIIRWQRAA
jgi:DNA-binding winged helix-turn-helix (wHTH) protein